MNFKVISVLDRAELCRWIVLFCLLLAPLGERVFAECAAPATGLVGWWRAENNGADVTGAHDGSFPYGIAYAPGEAGQAFDFNSSSRRLSIPDSPAFQLTNAMTLEGWVYPRVYGGFICFRGDNRGGLDTWVLDTYQSGFVNFQIDDENNNYQSLRAPIVLNQWQHIAATWDRASGAMKIYVNGSLVTETNTTVIPIGQLDPGSEPAIGIGNHGGTFHQFPMDGLVDEFAIYNRAITATEVQSIYSAAAAGKCLPTQPPACTPTPAGLIGLWRGDGNALDSAANNNGTLTGNAAFGAGRVGQGFVFDGDGDLIPVGAAAALQLQDFTIEAWIQRASTAQVSFGSYGNGVIFGFGQDGYGLYLDPNGVPALSKIGINETKPATSITDTNFHHLAVTKSGSTVVFYVDGVAYSAPAYDPGFTFSTGAAIGARGDNLDNSFLGSVDEVSVYNRALDTAEIQSIYSANSAGKCAFTNLPPSACVTPPTGLVGWWQAENNGTDVTTSNSGTAASGLGFTPGKVGQAFSFDGSDDHFDIPASASLNVGAADGLTFETWVKPSSIAMQVVAEWNNGGGGVGAHLWLSVDHTVAGDGVGNILVNLYDTTETSHGILAPAHVITANEWQHIAVTYDKTSGAAKIYRNGVVVASQNLGTFTPQTSYDLHLGYRASSAFYGTYFGGLMDEPSLYNRALTGTEIQSIYAADSAGKCAPPVPPTCTPPAPSLVGWWPAEGDAHDLLGANNGGLAGATGYSLGKVGQAFAFNNNPAAVVIPASPSLNVGSGAGFTLEAWINPADVTQAYPLFEWNSSTYWGVHFHIAPGQPTSGSAGPGGPGQLYANIVDSSGGWHQLGSAAGVVSSNMFQHLALTYDKASGVATIFRNGEIVSQLSLGSFSPLTTYDLYLGRRQSPIEETVNFVGLIDEPAVYNRALSQAEVQSIYQAGSAGKCPPVPVDQFIIAGPITNAANGHAYYLTTELSWHDAEALGVRLGGHLTTINDDDENNWVFNTFSTWGETGRELWIGLTDEVVEGQFRWSNGSFSNYRHWLDSQPDNYGGESPGEDYVHFWMPNVGAPPGTWNDAPGHLHHYGVIEVNPDGQPEPMPTILAGPITNTANEHAYYLLAPTNWAAAEAIAVSLGGHLATINDATENSWVYNTFSAYNGGDYTLWIGLTDQANEGDWRWISDSPATFRNWTEGEPNNWNGNENHGWIWNPTSGAPSGWNDAPGDYLSAAVVEIGVDAPQCTPPPAGLIGLWPAEENALDRFGLNHGTRVNEASFANGIVGQAFRFDGVNDYVAITQTSKLNPSNQVTIEFWMKADPENAMNSYQGLVTSDFYGIEIANGFAAGPVGVSFFISTDGGASVSPSSYPDTATDNGGGAVVSPGAWHHVAGTYDGTKLQLYIDGQPWGVPSFATGAISPMLANSFVSIGGEDGRTICPDCIGSRYFNGLIDEAAIYNRALSAEEILAIYNANSGGKCPSTSLDQLILVGPITNSANGHAYYLTTELSWHEAEAVGVRLGGHLVTINDATENAWVFDTFGFWGEGQREMWIGLNDEEFEGFWRWSSGSTAPYRQWGGGQPDNYENEDFVHFWRPDGGDSNAAIWNDASSWVNHFGVIEVGVDLPLALATNCIAAPAGLVAWWQAENNAVDLVSGNNGTPHNGAGFSLGNINQSFVFDGTGSYVEVPHASTLVMTNEVTIEFWVKRQEPFGSDYIVNKGGDWTGGVLNYGVAIAPPEYGNILHFTFAGGNRGTIGITDLNWHHCAVVARNGDASVAFYVDGVPTPTTHFEGAETVNLYPSTQPLLIGAQLDPIANYFSKTLIDELSLYNRALTAEEIAAICLAGSFGKCSDAFQPIAMPDALSTGTNTLVSFNPQKLLLNDSDPRSRALSVSGVNSNTAFGGTVALVAGRIHYTPPLDFSGNDLFTYSITNDYGSSASSTVTATVGTGGQVPLNRTYGPVLESGEFVVRFAGVPGLTYTIEAAPSVNGPWTKVTNLTAPMTNTGFGIGGFEFREPVGAFESRFYRTIYPSY